MMRKILLSAVVLPIAACAMQATPAQPVPGVSFYHVSDAGVDLELPVKTAADGTVCQSYVDGLKVVAGSASLSTGEACGFNMQVDTFAIGPKMFVQLPSYLTADGRHCGRFLTAVEQVGDGIEARTAEKCDVAIN